MNNAFSSLHAAQLDLALVEAKLVQAQGASKHGARLLQAQAVDELAVAIANATAAKRALEQELWNGRAKSEAAGKGCRGERVLG